MFISIELTLSLTSFLSSLFAREYQIASLQHQLTRAKASNTGDTNKKQILHTGMVVFVYSMVHYVNHVHVDVTGMAFFLYLH